MAWLTEGLEEGGSAERFVELLALLLVDAPLADECVFQDLARLEG